MKKQSIGAGLTISLKSQKAYDDWHKMIVDRCWILRDHLFFLSENGRYRGVFERMNKEFDLFIDRFAVLDAKTLIEKNDVEFWIALQSQFNKYGEYFATVYAMLENMRLMQVSESKKKTDHDFLLMDKALTESAIITFAYNRAPLKFANKRLKKQKK